MRKEILICDRCKAEGVKQLQLVDLGRDMAHPTEDEDGEKGGGVRMAHPYPTLGTLSTTR